MEMTITFPGGARVDAQLGTFTIRTDQPAHAGGNDSAPAPFSLFLASIGTCAGIYVLGFCKQRGLPVDGIQIVQRTLRRAQYTTEEIERRRIPVVAVHVAQEPNELRKGLRVRAG